MEDIRKKRMATIKMLGKIDYPTYESYLSSRTKDELVDIKINLEIICSKSNRKMLLVISMMIIIMLMVLGVMYFDFMRNALQVYSFHQAMIRTKDIGFSIGIMGIFLVIMLFLLYRNFIIAKRKLKYFEVFLKGVERSECKTK
jgi:hypothetical protein